MSKIFQLRDDPNETTGLHAKIRAKKDMLVELCIGNYAAHDGLINGADGLLNGSSLLPNSQTIIWILFNNSKTGHLTRIKKITCIHKKYTLHGHQLNRFLKIFKLVQILIIS